MRLRDVSQMNILLQSPYLLVLLHICIAHNWMKAYCQSKIDIDIV